jgi:serine/threonine protein kinase
MTTPERWRQVTEVFHAALSRDASARATYLEDACAGDRALRAEVDAMFAAHQNTRGFGDRPVSGSIDDGRRLETGAMIGPYRIDRLIGAGGMGEVYRARDTKLGREVAIKVLPDAFLADPERLARFEREARLLAALNHPHIGAIYGFEEADPSPGSGQPGVRALVLELVEGETLADRVSRGPVPVATRPRCRSRSKWRQRWRPRTKKGSSIAISSRPTSFFKARGAPPPHAGRPQRRA